MTHPADRDAIDAQQREDRQAEKWFQEQLRADVQQVMNMPAARRILWLFMLQTGLDASPFATNAMAQSHAIGMQDAAKWWLNLVRDHCPEKEAQIRREGLAQAKPKPTEEESEQ